MTHPHPQQPQPPPHNPDAPSEADFNEGILDFDPTNTPDFHESPNLGVQADPELRRILRELDDKIDEDAQDAADAAYY